MTIAKRVFPDPKGDVPFPVREYTLSDDRGLSVSAIDYGAILTDVRVPDREGKVESVVLRFPDLAGYIAHRDLYLGAQVGRTAGRIDGARFTLNGTVFELPANDGGNCLHGNGEFSTARWAAETEETEASVSVTFRYTSPDGSNGYPGEVRAEVAYVLDREGNFRILQRGISDRDTLYDPTNHTYFNLSGDGKRDLLSQTLIADADRVMELRDDLIPTGVLLPVEGTAFDFQRQASFDRGQWYDHPFLFREDGSHTLRMTDPVSGRTLTFVTDAPAFVMYTCNEPEPGIELADGPLVPFAGAALEAQGLPDAIHRPDGGNAVLRAGTLFSRETSWTFGLL